MSATCSLILARRREFELESPALPTSSVFSAGLDDTYGAYLLGTFVSLIFYGTALHQFYRYIRLYPSDTPYIKILVVTVMILETAQIILLMHTCYYYLVSNYDHPAALILGVWSINITPMLTGFITATAQFFFARRAALLGFRYKIAVAIAAICLLAHLGLAIAVTVVLYQVKSIDNLSRGNEWMFGAGVSFATLADLLLSGSIIAGMRQSRRASSNRRTSSLPEVLKLYIVNTGLLTGLFNAIPSFIAAAKPKTLVWAAFNLVAARLYANTLLAVLNSRRFSITRGMEIFGADASGTNIIARANHLAAVERWNAPQIPDSIPTKISINVTAETEADTHGPTSSMQKVDSDNFGGFA
ncbi:hypothetical protein BV20DRAFT_330456 [Pilatotrama ljubarskyi]|nr:hypothetical protein BV20DRAFT_330456 [Pilatotrama ljubarskyi]